MSISSINPLSQYLVQDIQSMSVAADADKSPSTNKPADPMAEISAKYDIHHMSINDLSELSKDLNDAGLITVDEQIDINIEKYIQAEYSGYPADEKMDMAAHLQNRIDTMKSQPQSKGVEYVEHILDILKGVDARKNAVIPTSV